MVLISNWLFFFVFCIKCFLIEGETFNVASFGAIANDGIDDTRGIQLAINSAINYRYKSTVVFGYGTYNISAPLTVINATNLTIEGQGIDKTLLLGTESITIFWVVFGTGVTLSSFSIDFDPLSFTGGYVVNVNDSYIDVRIEPPHRADIGRQVKYILRYDPVEMRAAFGPKTYAVYQTPPSNVNTTVVSENVLRMPLSVPSSFVIGDAVVAHFLNPNDTIFVYGTVDFTVQSITLYSSWAMGLFTMKIKRFNIINFHIIPRDGRWLSGPADCIHVVSSREYVNVVNSTCQATGDDGLNVFRPFIAIADVVNSTTIIAKTGGTTDPYIQVGEHIEFTSKAQPFTVYATGTVISSASVGPDKRILTFNSSINASIGDWICNVDLPTLTIRNFTVHSNRARGVVLETRNIDIRDSVFNRTSAPAVIIQPSLNYHEGPEARNVTLSHNLFINCNEGIGQQQGIIALVPDPIQLITVINDIIIESSSFYYRDYSEHLLESFNVNNLIFRDNYIQTNMTTPVVQLCNARNITAHNNTYVNIHGKLEEYYGFEGRHGCQVNLTTLIDISPFAFNSSFPPPV